MKFLIDHIDHQQQTIRDQDAQIERLQDHIRYSQQLVRGKHPERTDPDFHKNDSAIEQTGKYLEPGDMT